MSEFIPSDFPQFRPAGAGGPEASERLTRHAINHLVPSLLALHRAGKGKRSECLAVLSTSRNIVSPGDGAFADYLAELFERSGSDKARHGYHLLYARVLREMGAPTIFEVGLGSNDPTVPSNMGSGGSPGASLRAFQEALEDARVIGGDVDPKALKGHDFEVFFLDQLDSATFPTLDAVGEVDLLIDDGLHMPAANINTLSWGLTVLSGRGVIVVEDIPDASLPVWEIVASVLPERFMSGIFRGTSSNAFVTTQNCSFEGMFEEPDGTTRGQQ